MLNIVFMGTPEFAVPSLDILNRNHNVAAVVTAPDKPAGRGRKTQQSAVKKYAESQQITCLQPAKLKDPEFINALKNINPDLIVVVAFRMLPEVIWKLPPKGTINLHASLLPQYRGAAPINHAIINGETKTGVTTFFINDKIDTGKILFQETVNISKSDNAGTLHDKLMEKGAKLIRQTVNAIEKNDIRPWVQQTPANIKPAPKLFKKDCRINWQNKGKDVVNLIRGLSPYPTAWSKLKLKKHTIGMKIFDAEFFYSEHKFKPGTIHNTNNNNMDVAVADGFVRLNKIQPENKKPMSAQAFLQGYDMSESEFLSTE
ncbi:MAG: methionyl-tRNA formyltransferase [Bacteroidales bacterium]